MGWAKAVGQAGAGVNTRGRDVIDVIEATPTGLAVQLLRLWASRSAPKLANRTRGSNNRGGYGLLSQLLN